MRASKVQASLRIRAVSPEPSLLAHTSSESRRTFRQKARSLAPLNGWACAVKICHDGMLEDTNSFDGAQIRILFTFFIFLKDFLGHAHHDLTLAIRDGMIRRRGLMDGSPVPCEVRKGLARVGRTVVRYEHLTYAIARHMYL